MGSSLRPLCFDLHSVCLHPADFGGITSCATLHLCFGPHSHTVGDGGDDDDDDEYDEYDDDYDAGDDDNDVDDDRGRQHLSCPRKPRLDTTK